MDKLSVLVIMFFMAVVIFCLFTLMTVGKALAEPWGRAMGRSARISLPAELSPEQSVRMEKIRQDYWRETIPLRQEIGAKRMEIKLLNADAKTEAARIDALKKEIQYLQEKIREKDLNYHIQCKDFLLPEQQSSIPSFGQGRRMGIGKGWKDR